MQAPTIRQTLVRKGPGGARSFFCSRHRLLRSLEQRANSSPTDPNAQAAYLQALYEANMYREVLHRCESGLFSTNQRVATIHELAISSWQGVGTGSAAYAQPSLAGTAGGAGAGAAGVGGAGVGGAAGVGAAGTSDVNPIYVETTNKRRIWPLFAMIGLTVGLLMYMRSSGGVGGLVGDSYEFSPERFPKAIKFPDVCGCEEAKSELQDVVHFLSFPESHCRLGGKVSQGILLVGPPGSGKTLLAKAVAGEAGVPFFSVSGSQFEEMFVGVGASRMRKLFKTAGESSPCIIFIDEIDAVGSKRNPMERQSMRQTINELLVQLDGFSDQDIIVIAATNVPDALDPALVRAGRFDRRISVPLPNLLERQEILELYLGKVTADPDMDISGIAGITAGASGADLANLVNMAAVMASKADAEHVKSEDLLEALETLEMGAVRKTYIMTPKEVKNTAYHESGHAIMAALTPGSDPIYKATIVPRGKALGMVLQKPLTDKVSYTRQQLVAKLDILMGGRVAEEVFNGEDHVTTGASNDMMKATQIARRMVQEWGFSDEAGLVHTPLSANSDVSPATQEIYDGETKRILNEAYARAKNTISSHKEEMHALAGSLIEKQTLTGEEIYELVGIPNPTSELDD